MGVRITAYEDVTLVKAMDMKDVDWDDFDEGDLIFLFNHDFPERSGGMPEGVYRTSGRTESVGYNYFGYGAFRDQLCLAINGVPAKEVWGNPDLYEATPLYDLINFADNEGFLGSLSCAQFAKDAPLLAPTFEDAWFQGSWDTWLRMFEIAGPNGVLYYS